MRNTFGPQKSQKIVKKCPKKGGKKFFSKFSSCAQTLKFWARGEAKNQKKKLKKSFVFKLLKKIDFFGKNPKIGYNSLTKAQIKKI